MDKRYTGDISSYRADFLDCRDGHDWHWLTDWNILRGRNGRLVEFTRTKQCGRCKCLAHRTYDGLTGRVVRSSHVYPDSYLVTKGTNLDAGTARLEMLRREGMIGDW